MQLKNLIVGYCLSPRCFIDLFAQVVMVEGTSDLNTKKPRLNISVFKILVDGSAQRFS